MNAPDGTPDDRERDARYVDEPDVVPGSTPELGRTVSRDVAIYTIGTVAANAILYLSVPIYTRAFPPEEYSKFAFVTTISGLLGGVLVLGGDTALARFWFQDARLAARRTLCVTWVGFLAVWAAVICLLLLPASPALASFTLEQRESASLFLLALVTLPLAQTSRMVAQIMRNQFRAVPFVVTGFALGVLTFVGGLTFALGFDMGVKGIFVGILSAESAVLVVRTVLTLDMFHGTFDPALLRTVLRFGVPLVPVTLSFWVFTAADRVVVGKVAGLTELGYYSVAVTVTTVFAVLTTAVSQAWLPRAIQLYETDRPLAASAIGASLTYYVFGLGLLATIAASFAKEVTAVLSGSDYAPAAAAIPLLCLGSVAYGSQTITAAGMTMRHRTGWLATISIAAAAVNVVAALALVPPFGIRGAAAATVIGYGLLTAAFLWASQRLWAIAVEWRRLAVVIVLLAIVTTVTTWRYNDPLAVRAVIPVLFVGLCLGLAGVHHHERAALRSLRSMLRR